MKFLKWIVMARDDPGGFYGHLGGNRYLSGVHYNTVAGWYEPVFSSSDPALYPHSSARFQAKELRRVGYNVRCVPYLLVLVSAWIKARKTRLWKH